jgi:hypothetical protein
MDPEVKQALDQISAKFEERFDQLKERIEAIEEEVARLGRVETRVSSKVDLGRMDRR